MPEYEDREEKDKEDRDKLREAGRKLRKAIEGRESKLGIKAGKLAFPGKKRRRPA